MSDPARDYVAIANAYAQRVVSRETPACLYVRQAAQRQLDDLAHPPEPYRWDPERAAHACRFIEKLPHIKGRWARQQERLMLTEAWVFVLTTVFGWVDGEGRRRYKTAYIEVPRKNAKSTVSAGVALYLLCADGEEGAEVVSAATVRDQAKIVWQDAKRMVERSPGMRLRFGVDTSAHSIFVEASASSFKPLSRDQGGNLDGLNVSGGIVDELHAHKTRDIFDVLETATGAREQPLLWLITTAGFNRAGICYEQRRYALGVLAGQSEDPEYFGIVYTVDAEDLEDEERLLTDPVVWAKANPNWAISVSPEDIARKARKALELASARPNFLTKHLNVWINADSAWMDMVAWDRAADADADLQRHAGARAWLALDLASKVDIAALYVLVETADGLRGFSRNYVPESRAEEDRNSQYAGWVRTGALIATPGEVTDYEWIESDVEEFARSLDIQAIGYDPWQATYLATRLMAQGLPLVEYRQTVQNMSEPMKQVEADVIAGVFRHDANPCMDWMISNVVCHRDAKDNVYPRKESDENKIDGPVALIMARGMAMAPVEERAVGIAVV